MSVMVLRFESFGNVRKTLGSVSIREGAHAVNVGGLLGVSNMRTPDAIDKTFAAIDKFVQDCYKWNCKAYALRYDEKCEPTETEWNTICNSGEIVSKAQLFETLSCIDYNSDCDSYVTAKEYASCEWREEFETFRKTLDGLCRSVAESIAWTKADEEGCQWG